MNVMIRTDAPDVVKRLLIKCRIAPARETIVQAASGEYKMLLDYSTDRDYREIVGFISHAIGCGLVSGFDVIR